MNTIQQQKEGTTTWNNIYESHYAKWKTPNQKKDYILYNSVYIKCLEEANL